MNGLLSMFAHSVNSFMEEQEDIHKLNLKKQDECLSKYIQAKNLPRKKKKHVRKLASKDYWFWRGIDNYHTKFIKACY